MAFKKMTQEEKKKYQKERKKELEQKLDEGIQAVFEDGRFADYLKLQSCFRQYSINNTILILLQEPGATYVAGKSAWKKLNRHLIRGASPIRIFAYLGNRKFTKTEVKDDGEEESIDINAPMYTTTCVYNISETESDDATFYT